jgi:hypothetical protein
MRKHLKPEVIPNLFRDPTRKVSDRHGANLAREVLKQVQHDSFFILFIGVLMLFSIGCTTNKDNINAVQVSFENNKQAVRISGLDQAVMQEINRDPAGGNWQSLLPVYRMPADTDLKNYQPVQPGTYQIKNNSVIFTPDTPFMAHQAYFVRYYKFDAGNKVSDFIMGHNRPGSLHYSDLIIK